MVGFAEKNTTPITTFKLNVTLPTYFYVTSSGFKADL